MINDSLPLMMNDKYKKCHQNPCISLFIIYNLSSDEYFRCGRFCFGFEYIDFPNTQKQTHRLWQVRFVALFFAFVPLRFSEQPLHAKTLYCFMTTAHSAEVFQDFSGTLRS